VKSVKKKLPKRPKRNLSALQAKNQKAGVMKDRREPRGGARNQLRDNLREAE
jgi:hypothetical protein